MKSPSSAFLVLLACACGSEPSTPGNQSAAEPPANEPALAVSSEFLRADFEDLAEGSTPAGWKAAETLSANTPGTWSVRAAPGGGRAVHLATPNHGGTFNLLLSPEAYPADLQVSVRVRSDGGEEDQGGGLLWRASGPDDYYVARWNPLEQNLRVYKVVSGVRTMLQNADTKAAEDAWHTLAATMIGDRMQIALDGERLLDTTDTSFAGGGRVGLWTKADAATWFDDLVVQDPPWPDQR